MAVLMCKPLAVGGDGSEGKPFGDLQQAHDRAAPGDTLRLLAGVYPRPPRATVLKITKPLSVEADVGAELEVGGCSNGIVVDGRDVGAFAGVTLAGVRLRGDVSYCHVFFHSVSEFAVRHCAAAGQAAYGMLVLGDCADFWIRRNTFAGQARNLCIGEHVPRTVGPHRFVVRKNVLDRADGGGNGDGLQVLGNCTVDGRVEGNTIIRPSDDAMDIGNGARRILVRGNELQCDPACVGDGVGLKVGTREVEMQFPCSVLAIRNTITGAKTHAMELTGASRPGETARSLLISVGNMYGAALTHDTGFVEAADIATVADAWGPPPLPFAPLRLRDGQGTKSPSRMLFEGAVLSPETLEALAQAYPEWAEDLAWASRELERA